ncbi:MAG: LPD38 domain-containing protein, partial [Dehalococcoidales bacterium]|nr:LPD38 domain-containing protein [Dehalococcoidales bacterium]
KEGQKATGGKRVVQQEANVDVIKTEDVLKQLQRDQTMLEEEMMRALMIRDGEIPLDAEPLTFKTQIEQPSGAKPVQQGMFAPGEAPVVFPQKGKPGGTAETLSTPQFTSEADRLRWEREQRIAAGQQEMGTLEPAPQPAESVPNEGRFYHGTGSDFDAVSPDKFDPNGLYGPGYYLTDNADVAGSYAEKGQTVAQQQALQAKADAIRAKGHPNAEYLAKTVESQIQPASPNVRAVGVPEGLRLLDVEGKLQDEQLSALADAISQYTGKPERSGITGYADLQDFANKLRSAGGIRANAFYDNLSALAGRNQAAEILRSAGYDGIRYPGGKIMPIRDAAGNSVEHTAVVIFPESAYKVKNAVSGRPEGRGALPVRPGDPGGPNAPIYPGAAPWDSPNAVQVPDAAIAESVSGARLPGETEAAYRQAIEDARLAREEAEQGATIPPEKLPVDAGAADILTANDIDQLWLASEQQGVQAPVGLKPGMSAPDWVMDRRRRARAAINTPRATGGAGGPGQGVGVSQLPGGSAAYLKHLQRQQQVAGSVDKGGVTKRAQGFLSDVKRKLVDSTAPIEDILVSAQKEGKYIITPAAHITPQIDRAIRARELAGQFLKDNGLVDVIKQAPDINALDQYLIAKHAPEVAAEGFETGRNVVADARLVQDLAPIYEPFAQRVTQYGQSLLDYVVETGLIGTKSAAALKAKYPRYVPLNRIFNELERGIVPEGVGKGVASLARQTIVQKLKGSKRAIRNPTESLLTKTLDAFSQGERNLAGQMLASYKDLPGNPFQLRELAKGESAVHTVSYLDDGVKRTFETTPEVAQAAKFLDKRQLELIGQIFALPVRLARVGITGLNIPFITTNVAKDQITGIINSNRALQTSLANPPVFLKSLWAAIGHGAAYDDWIRSAGGGTSFDISRSAPNVTIAQIRAGKSVGSQIAYTVTHPAQLLRTVEDIVKRGEEFTRLMQFYGTEGALLKEGRTMRDANILAGNASRKNTVDFLRSGDWGKVINSALLYVNAGVQGSRTLMRNLSTRPVQTTAKIVLTVFTPLAAVTAWNLSDPERKAAYDDIRDYEKENNLVIIPPNPTRDANGKWNVIKIPFSQEIAQLTIPVRKGIEALQGYDAPDFGDFASAILGAATSLNTQSPNALVGQFTPQAVKPPLESILNKNLFTGSN